MGAGASSQWQVDPAISGIGALTNSGKEQGLAPAGPPLSRHGSTKQDKGGSDNGQDARWCARVKRYVEQQYGPEIKASLATAGSSEKGQAERFTTLAKNYVNFWLEAADLEECPDSAFRALRTDDICDRYFRIGGKYKIPLNKLVVEEVLMARDSDSVLPKDVFAKAMLEAKEYLDAEVLPFFYSSTSKLGFRAVKNNPSLLDSTNSSGSSSGLGELNENDELVDWLEDDPKHPFEFRAYLSASQPEMVYYLDFLLESYDFAMLYMADNGEEGMEEESAVLVHFNDLFDRYLMLGNEIRSELPPDIVSEMFKRARSEDEVDGAILDDARIFAQSSLLSAFTRHRRDQGSSLLHSTMRALEIVAADRKDLPDLDRVENLLKNETKCREFQDYTAAHEPATLGHAVQFCMAVMEFEKTINEARQTRTEQSAIVHSQAAKIFEEFLKHQAPKEMGMITGDARRGVLRDLRCPNSLMFASCRELALRGIATSGVCGRFHTQASGSAAQGGQINPFIARKDSEEEDEHEVALGLILRRHEFCRTFKKWAEQEFLLVPIQFWFETNEFLRLPHADLLLSRSRKIMRMYVVEGAPRRFNLTPEVVLSIQKNTSIPGPAMFVDAQREAYNFMETQMMPRFRLTGHYKLIRMSFMVDDLDSGMGGLGGAPAPPKEGTLGQGAEQAEDARNDPAAFANTEVPNTMVTSQMTLKNCLRNPLATRFFLEFCTSRQHGETVMFWIEANDFKAHVPGKRFMVLQARKIYNKYMGDGAKNKVKLSTETQQRIAKGLDNPQKNFFMEAQEEAFVTLNSELYPAFLTSPQFEELLELARYETVWDTIKRRVSLVFDPSHFRRNSLLGGKGQGKTSFTLPWSNASSPHPSEEAPSAHASPLATPTAADASKTLPAPAKRSSMINSLRSHLTSASQPFTNGSRSPSGSFTQGDASPKGGEASTRGSASDGANRLSLKRLDNGSAAPAGT